jgi:hypothetical protein
MVVQEYMLQGDTWQMTKAKHRIARTAKCFAPANMRAAGENPHYQELLQSWIAGGFKLRYSGGMVPDVHHIIAKVGAGPCCVLGPWCAVGCGGWEGREGNGMRPVPLLPGYTRWRALAA